MSQKSTKHLTVNNDYKVRRLHNMTIVQFVSEFILRLRPVVTLKKEFRMVQLLIEGELCCTRPDYFAGKDVNHRWEFRIEAIRDRKGLRPTKFLNRDRSGSYSTFFRALIWEFVQKVV